MSLGKRISTLRKERKLSQQELANRLYVDDKTISSWEIDRTKPNLEMIIKLSEILDCSASYLIYGDIIKNDIECEIKIKLSKDEFEKINLFMNKNAEFLKESKQKDTYYQPRHRKFINKDIINEWLRIGERGNKKILNYKNWYDNYCDEYEVEVDNVENLNKIFEILGLEKIVIVDKIRKTYYYLNKYEVALDYVKKLCFFIEIEIKKYDKSLLEEYDNLLKVAKDLNLDLNNIDKRGYPYYLINKNIDI